MNADLRFLDWRRLRSVGLLLRRFSPYAREHRRSLAAAGGATVLYTLAEIARPWPLKVVIDQVILGHPWSALPEALQGPEHRLRLLWVCAATLIGLALASGTLAYLRTVLLAGAGHRVVLRMREDLHAHLLRLSLRFHGRHRTGDLVVRLTGDASMMKVLLVEGVFALAQEIALLLAVLAVMLWFDWQLTLGAALVLPCIAVVVVGYGGRLREAARRQRRKEGKIAAKFGEALGSVAVLQAYSLEKLAAEQFARQSRKSLNAGLRAVRLEGAMSRWTELALAVGVAGMLTFGTLRVLDGRLSAGELVALLSYVRQLFKPLRNAVVRTARLIKSAASGDRLLEVLDTEPELVEADDARSIDRARGELVFEGVGFEYAPDRPVLRDVDLRIAAGTRVALVGPNGSGKTTLASLVPRLLDPTHGTIRLDGTDLRSIELESLRRQVSVLFQQSVLLDGDLLQNVRLGRPEANDEEVLDAAERAGVTAFARALPDGLATRVGEKGLALSGGQRQRVAVARALLRDAPIVILDEPATALDSEAEALMTSELMGGLSDRTVLLITHDPRSMRLADEVVVLDHGRVVARDTPEAILAAGHVRPRRASQGAGR